MDAGKARRPAQESGYAGEVRMSDDRPVRIIFDSSAILAFTRGSIHAGEPLAEVALEGGVVGLPSLCLAEAQCAAGNDDRLNLLIEHHATVVVPLSYDWIALTEIQHTVGIPDATSAMMSAIEEDSFVLTARSGLYAGIDDGGLVIQMPR
jgi:hypothetical protein